METLDVTQKRRILARLLQERSAGRYAAPLSYPQQHLWRLQQAIPNTALFNIPTAVWTSGPLNLDALQKSFQKLIERHHVLHTTFTVKNGLPLQVVDDAARPELEIVDLSELSVEDKADAFIDHNLSQTLTVFDLNKGPLLRIAVVRLASDENVLLLTIHHLICDGWSIGVIIQEISELYSAYSEDRAPSLPELPIQYADFARWQRKWLDGPECAAHLTYWRQQLSDPLEPLNLPFDHARPGQLTLKTATAHFELPAELYESIKDLSHRANCTIFTILWTALSVLLQQLTNETDIRIGTLVANRSQADLEKLIGLFVSTLVLRLRLSHEMRFLDLLRDAATTLVDALSHQKLPFEKLVDQLEQERAIDRSSLFQVMFIMQNAPLNHLQLRELELRTDDDGWFSSELTPTTFDLTLVTFERDDNLRGFLKYKSDLFEAVTIEKLLHDYQAVLSFFTLNPSQLISSWSPEANLS